MSFSTQLKSRLKYLKYFITGKDSVQPTMNTFDLLSSFPFSNVSPNTLFEDYFSFDCGEHNFKITIADLVHFKKYCHILMFPGAELTIGKNVFFNNYCSINCLENIEIGDETMFGEGVKLYDHNHKHERLDKLTLHRDKFTTAPIKIGRNCWIGSNVTILKGVSVGDNVIIGANTLIYKSIPSNSMVKSTSGYTIESIS